MTLTGSRIIRKTNRPGVCIFAEKAVVGQKDPATGVLCQIFKKIKKSRVLLQICCTPCGMILSEKNRRRENHEKDPDN